MKRAFFLLCLATSCLAEPATDLKTHVWESGDKDKDGEPDTRIETTTRGKTRVLRVMRRTEAGITKTSREFVVSGDTVMIEIDEDGNGSYETIVIYNSPKNDMEAFVRRVDGSVVPVDAKTLAALKEQHAATSEFWSQSLGEKADPAKFPDAAKDLQKKLKEAEAQKTKATE